MLIFSFQNILLLTMCLTALVGVQLWLQNVAKRRAERDHGRRADAAPPLVANLTEPTQVASDTDTAEVRALSAKRGRAGQLRVVTDDWVRTTWIEPDGAVSAFRFSLN